MKTRQKNGTQTISKWEPPKPQTTLKKIRWKFPPVNPSVFFKGRILEWLQRLQGGIRHFNALFLVRRKFAWPSSKQWSHGQAQFLLYLFFVYHFVLHFFLRILPPFFGHVYCLLLSFHFHFFPDSNVLFFTLKRILSLYKSPKIAPSLTNEAFTYLFNWRSWKRRWMRTMWWATSRTMGDQLQMFLWNSTRSLRSFFPGRRSLLGRVVRKPFRFCCTGIG